MSDTELLFSVDSNVRQLLSSVDSMINCEKQTDEE